jgi:hypothetical protein
VETVIFGKLEGAGGGKKFELICCPLPFILRLLVLNGGN